MPDLVTNLGPLTFRSFSLFIGLALAVTTGVTMLRLRSVAPPGHVVDCLVGALVGAAVGARLAHVALQWDYFATHTDEIMRLASGGLDWHGALLGGFVGLALVARWRRLSRGLLLDALTPLLPVVALGGWFACWAAACGYGLEVDTLANYPGYAVAELPDVYGLVAPRYSTQVFGIWLSLALLVLAVVLLAAVRLQGRRFWAVLALLGLGMFAIGFYRGDAVSFVAGLRLDQWLDLGVLLVGIAGFIFSADRFRPPALVDAS